MRAPCSIEGCEKPSAGRGWCQMHWARWRKHGDPNKVAQRGENGWCVKPTCSVDGCDRPNHARRFCQMHLTRFKRHGDPNVVLPITGRPPKGDAPTYAAAHKRIARSLGPARNHPCVDCEGQAREWSYIGGDPDELRQVLAGCKRAAAYSLRSEFYVPRCIKCHRNFDVSVARAGAEIHIEELTT